MDDDSLKRELAAALNVDPSPEFLAKVRTRIAAEPKPTRWRLAWVMVPVAAAASVLLAVTSLMQMASRPTAPIQVSAPSVTTAPHVLVVERAEGSTAPARVQAARRESVPGLTTAEVLIAPEERLGFEYLVAMTSRVRVSETVQVKPDVESERPQLPEFEVAPITPIAPVQLQPLQIAALR